MHQNAVYPFVRFCALTIQPFTHSVCPFTRFTVQASLYTYNVYINITIEASCLIVRYTESVYLSSRTRRTQGRTRNGEHETSRSAEARTYDTGRRSCSI